MRIKLVHLLEFFRQSEGPLKVTKDFLTALSNIPLHLAHIKKQGPDLGGTVSYKLLYFVNPSLELVPLFTGMQERSIRKHSKD